MNLFQTVKITEIMKDHTILSIDESRDFNGDYILDLGGGVVVVLRGIRNDVYWKLNNSFHRDDGPAMFLSDGSTHWFQYGKRHREDGPATQYALIRGGVAWYLHDKNMSRAEHAAAVLEMKETV